MYPDRGTVPQLLRAPDDSVCFLFAWLQLLEGKSNYITKLLMSDSPGK